MPPRRSSTCAATTGRDGRCSTGMQLSSLFLHRAVVLTGHVDAESAIPKDVGTRFLPSGPLRVLIGTIHPFCRFPPRGRSDTGRGRGAEVPCGWACVASLPSPKLGPRGGVVSAFGILARGRTIVLSLTGELNVGCARSPLLLLYDRTLLPLPPLGGRSGHSARVGWMQS
jgi:hypothetical protein